MRSLFFTFFFCFFCFCFSFFFFFFFQAEDGIRDLTVTGVQTCALPISFVTYFCRRLIPRSWNWPGKGPAPWWREKIGGNASGEAPAGGGPSATMYKITAEPGYLRAELFERETIEETRAFLDAVIRNNAHQ